MPKEKRQGSSGRVDSFTGVSGFRGKWSHVYSKLGDVNAEDTTTEKQVQKDFGLWVLSNKRKLASRRDK